ncbi:hypothetical membrane protein [Amycolatopsis arida]|uniref:Hypothetical membrane protein n=1 Tax=Amycolatopsis arida TaxID=587909 RepID=A0A1I5ZD03_9PSEU|nr:DUF998 domain-containing protein [Amycolatopsis arida]TDX89507.1 putative membrane protein [Amycolatopsis arida]SFQ53997.1 hypothetical membrane protein [Amycolatopsis arida]
MSTTLPAPTRGLVRTAAASLVGAGLVYLVAEAVAAAAWNSPDYSYRRHYISDLGARTDGVVQGRVVDSPLHAVMNAGFVAQGVLFLAGAALVAGSMWWTAARGFVALAAVHAVGMVLVALVPENVPPPVGVLHRLGALLGIAGGNLAIIAAGRSGLRALVPRWLPGVSLALGIVGVAALVLLGLDGLVPPAVLAANGGLIERVSVYPIIAGELLVGALLWRARAGTDGRR